MNIKEQFEKDGYIIVKNFLSKEEHDMLNRECVSFTKYSLTLEHDTPPWVMNAPYNPCKMDGALTQSKLFRNLVRNKTLVKTARELLGVDDIETYISKFFPMIPKEGFSVGWHQDNYYIKGDPSKMISCDVFVNGATRQNGCLRVIPNSHHAEYYHGASSHGDIFNWIRVNETDDIIDIESNDIIAVFFHTNLVHGCYLNKSNEYRPSIAWEYKVKDYLPDTHQNHISQDVISI